jgi:hypothetical protein
MPNYFTLTRKADRKAGPVAFVTIDEEICAAFGVEPDEVNYFVGWYDSIGGRLAYGMTWDEIRASLNESAEVARSKDQADYADVLGQIVAVANWLEERFEANCGYSARRNIT